MTAKVKKVHDRLTLMAMAGCTADEMRLQVKRHRSLTAAERERVDDHIEWLLFVPIEVAATKFWERP